LGKANRQKADNCMHNEKRCAGIKFHSSPATIGSPGR
jgi:hypothetical protein